MLTHLQKLRVREHPQMVLEAGSQAKVVRISQNRMLIHHWEILSRHEENVIVDCILSYICKNVIIKESLDPE